jgi:hypothetical protein
MDKVIDLRDEFEESWDPPTTSDSWDVETTEANSIRAKFGWGADYLEQVNRPSTIILAGTPGQVFHQYIGPFDEQYLESEADAWGIRHHFPRFTATEQVGRHWLIATGLLSGQSSPEFDPLYLTPSVVREKFDDYRMAWQLRSETLSSVSEIVMLQEYQHIIGLGRPAIPFIIEALRNEVDHWFWALTSIVGQDHAEGAQTLQEAADRWIAWYDALVDNASESIH